MTDTSPQALRELASKLNDWCEDKAATLDMSPGLKHDWCQLVLQGRKAAAVLSALAQEKEEGVWVPSTAIKECNCANHRPGETTGGWFCPFHGQRW